MLISSLLISLKTCLPLFIFIAMLYTIRPPGKYFKRILLLVSVGLLLLIGLRLNAGAYVLFVDTLEWFYITCVCVFAIFSWLYFAGLPTSLVGKAQSIITIACICLHLPQSHSLMLYVASKSVTSGTSLSVLFTGVSVGMIISIAIAMIVYLIAEYLLYRRYWILGMCVLFIAGKILMVEHWLAQIGWFMYIQPLLSLPSVLHPDTPTGIIIHALFGFNHGLSIVTVVLYVIAVFIGVLVFYHCARNTLAHDGSRVTSYNKGQKYV